MKILSLVIRLFGCMGMGLCLFGGSDASHFLEPIGTEIPRIAPAGRFFLQSGVELKREDVSATLTKDEITAPVVLEYGLGGNSQLAFEANLFFKDENNNGVPQTAEKGPDEISIGFRYLLRGEPASKDHDHESHSTASRYECDCLEGNPLAFELEFAPAADKSRGSEVKLMFLYAQNVFGSQHLFLNLGFASEAHVHADGSRGYHPHVLYNAAWLVPMNRERLHAAAELNGKVSPGSTGNRAEWILRPQIIWYLPEHSLAVKAGPAFGVSHGDPERGGSLLVSRLF